MNYLRPQLLDRLASEYVLGTLVGGARRRFERVLSTEPVAQRAVQAWADRLAPLALSVPALQPPKRVWQAIESATQGGAPVASRRASSEIDRASGSSGSGGFSWASWSTWMKPAFGFAVGVAATVAMVFLMPQQFISLDQLAQREQALPQSYVGLLTDQQGQPTVLVSSTRHGNKVTVKFLRPVTVPTGKVMQVWALPKEGAAFPLGVTGTATPPGKTEFTMSATSEKLLAQVPRLAISFEDKPAAPGAQPGEFVLSGFCVKLW